jgi:P pilus assembly chaperone PapD
MISTTQTKASKAQGHMCRHFICALLMLLASSQAIAQVMIYPTRVVFEGNQRAAQVQLVNNGTESATYRISLVNRRMSETGTFSDIDTPLPGEQFADDMLRYSPRQVILAPGASQTVRIMVRKPAGLAVGEYRSHLLFSKQPEAKGKHNIETRDPADDTIGITLKALVSMSIPVIVRHGNTSADVSLTHLEFQKPAGKEPILAFWMERRGNQSVYGDLTVSFAPRGGTAQVIGRANGVAVYTPNPARRAGIVLDPPANMALRNGTLRITYREQAEDGGKQMAEAVLQLP